MVADFHLIALELGTEEQMLESALAALEVLNEGETAFLPEALAWTQHGSGLAFAKLIAYAQSHSINVVTTLNLGPDLHHDLPGRDPAARYHALTLFTRHGFVHVPQAKLAPHAYERSADGAVEAYSRSNRVQLDWQDELIDARFVIGSDLMQLARFSPRELRCDLLVVLGNFPHGAERAASRLLERALTASVARSVLCVNAYAGAAAAGESPLAVRVEEVLDATGHAEPPIEWPNMRTIRGAFYLYDDGGVGDFVSLCRLPRRGRIPVPRSQWKNEITLGEYPVTISL
jgi:hypothetical protein